MNWLQQLIGKLKSIGGREKADDTAVPTGQAKADAENDAAPAAGAASGSSAVAPEEKPGATVVTETVAVDDAPATEPEKSPEPVAPEPVVQAEPVAPPEPVAAVPAGPVEEPAKPEPGPVVAAESAPEPAGEVVAEAAVAADGPYGSGSAKPAADGSAPSPDFAVKAKESSKLFHTAKSPYFGRTRADVWFRTEDDAVGAGFQPWDHKKRAAAKK